jgi:uncharacterized protein
VSPATAPLRPVSEGERTVLLDVLRGFALLGIVLVNFPGSGPGTLMPRVDGFVSSFLNYAVQGSFYPLFSFLFGVGFGVQLLRARERGRGVALLYLRRMLVLLIIGTVHAVFIYNGDILVGYAFTGLLLIPLGKFPRWALLALVLTLFVISLSPVRNSIMLGPRLGVQTEYLRFDARNEAREIESNRRRANDGEYSYASAIAENWSRYAASGSPVRTVVGIFMSDIALLFLIGLYVARGRVFETAVARRRDFIGLGVASALAIALGHGLTSIGPAREWGAWWNLLSWQATNKGPTFLYIALITLFFTSFRDAARALSVFAAPGRMALTSYLTQTVFLTLLFVPYGVGLTSFTTTMQLLFCLGFFFLFQVPISHWWLARYQYGPAEWVWRSATYGAAQPMRRPPLLVADVEDSTLIATDGAEHRPPHEHGSRRVAD